MANFYYRLTNSDNVLKIIRQLDTASLRQGYRLCLEGQTQQDGSFLMRVWEVPACTHVTLPSGEIVALVKYMTIGEMTKIIGVMPERATT